MQFEISAKKRELLGTSASRRLRRAGRVPGILYGGDKSPQMIDFDHNQLFQAMRKEAFHSSVINLTLEKGDKSMCLLRDVQMHPFKPEIKHVDFQRIAAGEVIHQIIPLHFLNAEIAPGVKLEGGMVQQITTELDVKCLPQNLPGFIEIDLKGLNIGDSIHLSEVVLPEGVEPAHHGEDDPLVVSVVARAEASTEEVVDTLETEEGAKPAAAGEGEDKAEEK